MSLNVNRDRVKEKLGIVDADLDDPIDNLIAELLPVVTYAVKPAFIQDDTNDGLQSTLCLAATEIIAGEMASQMMRSPGGGEVVRLAGLTVEPLGAKNAADPTSLIATGWARLKPFLKLDIAQSPASVAVGKKELP